jgi:hypothetical protein
MDLFKTLAHIPPSLSSPYFMDLGISIITVSLPGPHHIFTLSCTTTIFYATHSFIGLLYIVPSCIRTHSTLLCSCGSGIYLLGFGLNRLLFSLVFLLPLSLSLFGSSPVYIAFLVSFGLVSPLCLSSVSWNLKEVVLYSIKHKRLFFRKPHFTLHPPSLYPIIPSYYRFMQTSPG